jgi:hypothetical protein
MCAGLRGSPGAEADALYSEIPKYLHHNHHAETNGMPEKQSRYPCCPQCLSIAFWAYFKGLMQSDESATFNVSYWCPLFNLA